MTTENGCYFCNRCNNRAALDLQSNPPRENRWKSLYLRAYMHEKRKLPPNQNNRGSLAMLLCTQAYNSGDVLGDGQFQDNYLVNSLLENQQVPWGVSDRIDAYNWTSSSASGSLFVSNNLGERVMNQAMDAGSVRLDDYKVPDLLGGSVDMFAKLYQYVNDSVGTSSDNDHVDMYVADRIVTDMLASGLGYHSELGIVDGNDLSFPFAYDYAINVPYSEKREAELEEIGSQQDQAKYIATSISFNPFHNSGRGQQMAADQARQALDQANPQQEGH